jgi:hypothetical protein
MKDEDLVTDHGVKASLNITKNIIRNKAAITDYKSFMKSRYDSHHLTNLPMS